MNMNKLLCAVFAGAALAAVAGEFDLQNAEFAKYHKAITGRDAPEGLVTFAIDPKVSKSGRDAYTILSGTLSQPAHGANGQDARSPRVPRFWPRPQTADTGSSFAKTTEDKDA